MQYNVDGRRKKKRQVDNIQPRPFYYQHLQQPVASAPLLSRLRILNNLALTSIGSFFSGPTTAKTTAHIHQDEEDFSGHGTIANVSYGNDFNADANRDSGCFWLEDPQNCLSSPENDDLIPVRNGFYSSEAVDYCSIQLPNPSSRRLGTHDNLDSSDSNVFSADAGALIRNDLPPVQYTSSSYAHTLPRSRPDVRHLFGDSRRSDTLYENYNQRDTYVSAEHSSQNISQMKFAATPERATNTVLCATAAVFVPSPAARALLFRDKYSFQTNVTGLDTASVHTETPTLTPDSSETGLLSPASFSTSFEHVDPSYAACSFDSSDGMPGGFRVEGNDNDKILYTSPQLLEVKEGKKREQPPAQQTNCDASLHQSGPIVASQAAPVLDDPEEWYGLEYTLELSSRERQPSDTQSFSAGGEHSKSRESWAAIHQGTIHPFFEDEYYYQWKNWHRLLDKQDERRKHKKGFAFKAHSKELSYLFVDEMRTRDVLYWQKGRYGVVAREVKERLNYITAHCPDPYFPPKKHDFGWYLKRSRSVACIRELKAIEDGRKG